MPSFARSLYGRLAPRRCASALLLVTYALTAAGVPLPLSSRPAKSGELFPCAASQCGCDSAERCWRSCCCHTLAERLAWARRHGVRPPEFVIAKARNAGLEIAWLDSAAAKTQSGGNCCKRPSIAKSDCCRAELTSATSRIQAPSCCDEPEDRPASQAGQGFVAWRALKCRGQSTQWLFAVPTLILVRAQVIERPPLVIWLGPAASESADDIAQDPAIPPPEVA